jgi:hypothetical protein
VAENPPLAADAPAEHRCRMRRLVLPLLLAAACTSPPPRPTLAPSLAAAVEAELATLGPDVRAGIWLSTPLGEPLLAIAADGPFPVASAIKAAYLVELFAAFPAALDAPLPSAAAVFADAKHPAIAHFPAAARETARAALANASLRRLGAAMITGAGVDNTTYNIAANLVTAHFGGPAWLDRRLHARAPHWAGLHVRRYMLTPRGNGDNEATPRALAAVHGMLALGAVPGVDDRAVAAARDVLAAAPDAAGRKRFRKGGSLDSVPLTRVEAGWTEGPEGTLVHVVMLAQDRVADGTAAAAGQSLAAAARRIESLLVDGATWPAAARTQHRAAVSSTAMSP